MRARRSDEPLHLFGQVEQPLDVRFLREVSELGHHAARVLERDAEGDRLRDAVRLAVRHSEDARHVADGRAREHRVERPDLRDAIGAVLLRDIRDDLVAAVVHEVDVDVREGVALEVQEAVEDEPVADRIDVGEVDRVVHERSAGRAAHGREDPVLARVADEVLHDEDVSRIAELADDGQLLVEPFAQLRRDLAVLRAYAGLGHVAQMLLGRGARRHGEGGQLQLAERKLDVDHLRDADRVLERLGVVREERGHLLGTLQIELRVVDHLEAVLRVDRLTALDADHHVLRLGVLRLHVVDVVRRDERDTRPARHLTHALEHGLLFRHAVLHQLEEVVALSEDLLMLDGDLAGRLDALVLDRARELSLQAGRERDEPLRMRSEDLPVHARAVVIAVEMRRRDERNEIPVAREVLREEDEVEGFAVTFETRVALEAIRARDVRLDADDRLDARLVRRDVEIDRTVERSVIGERDRRHAELFRARDQIGDAREPVQQAVLAVGVKVNERSRDGDPQAAGGSSAATTSLVARRLLRHESQRRDDLLSDEVHGPKRRFLLPHPFLRITRDPQTFVGEDRERHRPVERGDGDVARDERGEQLLDDAEQLAVRRTYALVFAAAEDAAAATEVQAGRAFRDRDERDIGTSDAHLHHRAPYARELGRGREAVVRRLRAQQHRAQGRRPVFGLVAHFPVRVMFTTRPRWSDERFVGSVVCACAPTTPRPHT